MHIYKGKCDKQQNYILATFKQRYLMGQPVINRTKIVNQQFYLNDAPLVLVLASEKKSFSTFSSTEELVFEAAKREKSSSSGFASNDVLVWGFGFTDGRDVVDAALIDCFRSDFLLRASKSSILSSTLRVNTNK